MGNVSERGAQSPLVPFHSVPSISQISLLLSSFLAYFAAVFSSFSRGHFRSPSSSLTSTGWRRDSLTVLPSFILVLSRIAVHQRSRTALYSRRKRFKLISVIWTLVGETGLVEAKFWRSFRTFASLRVLNRRRDMLARFSFYFARYMHLLRNFTKNNHTASPSIKYKIPKIYGFTYNNDYTKFFWTEIYKYLSIYI